MYFYMWEGTPFLSFSISISPAGKISDEFNLIFASLALFFFSFHHVGGGGGGGNLYCMVIFFFFFYFFFFFFFFFLIIEDLVRW